MNVANKAILMVTLLAKVIGGLLLSIMIGTQLAYSVETVTYYHTDGLGSPVAATDANGALLWKEDYKPYGERIRKQVESDTNSRWFTGHPEDKETGFVYAGARHYDPIVGRFMAIDAVGFTEDNPQMFNRYAYANNNPYMYVDPDGNLPILLLVPLAIKAIDVGITAYDTYNAYQEGGALGAAQELGVSAAASIVPGAKILGKVTKGARKPGSAGVDRTGKDFTPKTKRELDSENAVRNGGQNRCEDCGVVVVPGQRSQRGVTPPGNERHRDHIIPKSKGGDGTFKNGQILCRTCNLKKRDNL